METQEKVMREKRIKGARCKDCDEETIHLREKGLYECITCGRMFTKEPKPQPPKLKGDWRTK